MASFLVSSSYFLHLSLFPPPKKIKEASFNASVEKPRAVALGYYFILFFQNFLSRANI